MKRGMSGLCGVLAIDKPAGITSHDVVDRVRRITGERRVGHAGTLDPMATGLMFVGVGAATRLSNYLTGHDKSYLARIVFGVTTDTDDADGRVLPAAPTGAPGQGLEAFDGIDAAAVVAGLVGDVEQLPPAYSAIKKNGVTAYKAAREGKALELSPRLVTVHEAVFAGQGCEAVSLNDGQDGRFETELPFWDVLLSVSKGTYIRSIARDLGFSLGCGAYLGSLRRIRISAYPVDRACTLDELEACARAGQALPWCDPVSLLGFPIVELDDGQVADVQNGRELGGVDTAPLVSCVSGGKLLAIYKCEQGRLRPATVIPGGVAGVA